MSVIGWVVSDSLGFLGGVVLVCFLWNMAVSSVVVASSVRIMFDGNSGIIVISSVECS